MRYIKTYKIFESGIIEDTLCDIPDDFPGVEIISKDKKAVIKSQIVPYGKHVVRETMNLAEMIPILYSKIKFLDSDELSFDKCRVRFAYHISSSPVEKIFEISAKHLEGWPSYAPYGAWITIPYDIQFGTYRINIDWSEEE